MGGLVTEAGYHRFMGTTVNIPRSPDASALLDAIAARGHGVALVGGAVRDALLGRALHDLDAVTDASPVEVRAACEGASWCRRVYDVGERFGTLGVVLTDGTVIEVSRLRGDAGPGAAFADAYALDAGLRDFTVNAIAVEWPSLTLLDPANGRADIAACVLRAPGDPAARFAEDPLRVLRAARFVAELGFTVEPGTESAATAIAPELAHVAAERVRDELTTLLTAPRAGEGLAFALRTEALAVVLPEVAALDGVVQPTFHDLDVFAHTIQTVDGAPASPVLRWAALLHDIGKAPCRTVEAGGRIRFFGHTQQGAEMADAICRRLRFSNAERTAVVHLVREHMRLGELAVDNPKAVDRAVRRLDLWASDAENPHLLVSAEDAIELTLADFSATAHRAEAEAVRERLAAAVAASRERGTRVRVASPLSGRELMDALGLEEGPAVGAAMRAVVDAVAEGRIAAGDRAAALEVARAAAGRRCEGGESER